MTSPYVRFGVAVTMGRTAEALEILRRNELDPNGLFGRSPLSVAAEHGSVSVMRELIDRGARVDQADSDGHTPLWHATFKNSDQAVSLLLRHGAKTELNSALHLAAFKGNLEAAQSLIDGGADVNVREARGETPLMVAVSNRNGLYNLQGKYDEVIALLLRRGADPGIVGDHGYSASQLAEFRGMSLSSRSLPRASVNKGGCYVATAVYGSYDSPEVIVLRNFRDRSLAKTRLGRAAIATYYSFSPMLVRHVGKRRWFTALVRPLLDVMVNFLQKLDDHKRGAKSSLKVR